MKDNTIISILRNIKPTQTNTHMPLAKSIDEHISQLPILKTTDDTYCQEKILPDLLKIYLSALNYSLTYIDSLPESATETPQNFHNAKDSSCEMNQYLIFSPYKNLFFFNNHYKNETLEDNEDDDIDDEADYQINETAKTSDQIDANINSTSSIEESFSSPLIKKYISHTFPKALSPFAHALRDSIRFCPYSINPQLRSSPYRINTNILDKRKKELAETDIPASSSITLSDVKKGNHFINIFKDSVIKALLTIGGPLSVSYCDHIRDISSQNDNIHNPVKIVSFFRKTYKHTIELLEDADKSKHLFTLFTLETAFNGSFLLYFCEFFSGHKSKNIINLLFPTKIFNLNKDNPLYQIYEQLNNIENPFIKHMLLDEIICQTYYNDYFYDNCNRPAGKSNISQWCNDICSYSDSIAEMECRLYKTYLSYIFTTPMPKGKIIDKYYNLFQTSNVYYKNGTPKVSRSVTFQALLPEITKINYQYYPIDNIDKHPLFCPVENAKPENNLD